MAISPGLAYVAKQAFLDGVHQTSDTYKLAFYSSAANLDYTTVTVYTATSEVTQGANIPAGGVTLATRTSGVSAGVAYIDWADLSITVVGTVTVRGAMLYNSTRSNAAIALFDFGSEKSATDGPLNVTIPASGTGVVRFS